MTTTHILAAVIVIMAEIEIEIGSGSGTGKGTGTETETETADPNVTAVVAGIEVETGIGIGIEAGIEVGMRVRTVPVYVSADLPADSTLRATMIQRWASARAGGGRSRGPEAGITSTSLGQVETGAHEAHNTKEGTCDNDNIQ
jgi:hypothetical protein